MTLSLMACDGTIANTGTLQGGATAHEILADVSPSNYVALASGALVWCTLGTPGPSIPGDATVIKTEIYLTGYPFAFDPPIARTTLAGEGGAIDQRSITPPQGQWVGAYLIGEYDPDDASFAVENIAPSTAGGIVLYAAEGVVTWVAKPETAVIAPTGTLTEDNRPTVTWQNTLDTDGGAQFAAEVKIFNDAQYGAGGFDPETSTPFASGSIIGQATSWTPEEGLPNDTYRAYVKVSQYPYLQITGVESDWEYGGFVVDVPLPAVPDLAATADPDASPVGRIELTIDGNSGDATTDELQVQRLEDGEWVDIRTLNGDGLIDGSFPATIYDYDAPVDELVSYRARAIHNYSSSDAYSGWTATETATLSPISWALIHPTDPTLSQKVTLRSFTGYGREPRQSIKQPLGRSDAVVISDTRGPESGSIVFRLEDDAARDDVVGLIELEVSLLLRPATGDHERSRWVAIGGEQIARAIDKSWIDERDGTFEWTEVSRPGGNLAAWT